MVLSNSQNQCVHPLQSTASALLTQARKSKKLVKKPSKLPVQKPPSAKLPLIDLNEDENETGQPEPLLNVESDEAEDEEDQGEDEEDEDGGAISLSAMLEGEGALDESGDESGNSDNDNEDILQGSDDEESAHGDNEEALDKLDSFIDGLSSKKRKVSEVDLPQSSTSRKRRVLPERNEAGAESEFAAPGSKSGMSLCIILIAPN